MPLRKDPRGRTRLARPTVEMLEERALLSATPGTTDYALDHILVRFSTPTPQVLLAGTSVGKAVDASSGLYQIDLSPNVAVQTALNAYRADARVALADPDYYLINAGIPSDSRFGEQWSMRNTGQGGGRAGADIRAAQAWDVARGSTRTVVAVMDTGVDYRHPDLYQNIWINQREIPASRRANLLDTDGDGLITFRDLNNSRNKGAGKISDLNGNGYIDGGDLLRPMTKDAQGRDTGRGGWADGASQDGDRYVDDLVGWNFFDNNNNPMDDHGHGTHVAGTIGATGDNDRGVAGVNWAVGLMPIKFLNGTGGGTVSQFIEGLNYAVAKGARLSNNSWTGAGSSTALIDAIRNAGARGHIFVAAAGNNGSNNDVEPVYPGSFGLNNVVSVAATDRRDNLAAFSNYGARSVDIAAPGVDVLSTTPGGSYGNNTGTSMATPHVTGVLALVASQHPSWSAQQIIDQVKNTVDRLPALTGKVSTGGRLNAAAAVGAAQVSATAPRVVSAVASGVAQNRLTSIRVTFDRAINPSTFTPGDVGLVGPGSRAARITGVRVVPGSGNRVFDITFDAQTAPGTYYLRIGPEVKDLVGGRMSVYTTTYQIKPAAPKPAPRVTSAVGNGLAQNRLTSIRVTFDRAIALSTFTPGDVGLVRPGGKAVAITGVRVVAGTGDRVFDIDFADQTAAGTYSLRIGPEVMAVSGTKMATHTTTFRVNAPAPRPGPRVVSAVAGGLAQNRLVLVRVTFDRAIALSTFTPGDVGLVGPSGRPVRITGVRVVAGSGDKVFDISFAPQTAAGSYALRIGPEVMAVTGTKMTTYMTTFRLVPVPPRVASVVGNGLAQNKLTSIRVTFDRVVAPGTFSPADVRLVGPGGRTVASTAVRAVAGTNNRVFDIDFADQTAAGIYSLRIGPEVMDVSGTKMVAYTTTFKVNAPAPRSAPRITSAVGNGLAQNRLTTIRVTFDRAVNPSTFTSGDVGLVAPGGRTVPITAVRAVAGTNNRVFDIDFADQTAAGNYSLRIGPEVKDVAGTKMLTYTTTFKVTAPAPKPRATPATYTSTTPAAILPKGRAVTLLTVNSNVRIADVNVRVNIKHPRMSDLYIHLQGPDGTNIVLFNRSGGNTANLTNTVFDDQASTFIALGRGPFTGSYQPISNLSNFNGKLAQGTWKLWVEDRGGVNRGTLVNWSITITPRA